MSNLVNREVLPNGRTRSPPHKGAEGRVQLDQKGAVTERGAIGGTVRDHFVKPGRCQVDLGRGADHPQGVTGTPYREVNSKVATAPNTQSRR